jgi:DinB superfamily/Ankyrin repeats (3 copies)
MMERVHQDLLGLADFAFARLRTRLAGLTDEEYFWEPAPGCWTIRQHDDGTWRADRSRLPLKPAPLTTIAWRMDHLTYDVLALGRNATWIGATPAGTLDKTGEPATAAGAISQLERAYDLFRRNIAAADPETLTQPMGEIAESYATESRAALVLHELDELIHHGSEIAAMRDVYRATRQADPFVEACVRGDHDAVTELLTADPDLQERHATLIAQLAADQRWDTVRRLVELGFDVNASGGITALHYAAAAGELAIIELLLDHGADRTIRDTEFDQQPIEWARFFDQDAAIKYLE